MDKTDFEVQAKALMTAHGVGSLEFRWSRTKRAIAAMNFVEFHSTGTRLCKAISFSEHWVPLMSMEECHDVLLHEIAHALTVDERAQHGRRFKAKCRELGTPATEACYKPEVVIQAKWQGICPNGHGAVARFHRAPLRVLSCTTCSPGRWKWENVLHWERDGKRVEILDMPSRFVKEWNLQNARYANPFTNFSISFGG